VPRGVADQVVHDLPQPLGIRDHVDVGGPHAQVHVRRVGLRSVRDRGLRQHVAEPHVLLVQPQFPASAAPRSRDSSSSDSR